EIRDIADDGYGASAQTLDGGFDGGQRRQVASVNRNGGAGFGKRLRDGCADSSRAARDKGHFVFERVHTRIILVFNHAYSMMKCQTELYTTIYRCLHARTAWENGRPPAARRAAAFWRRLESCWRPTRRPTSAWTPLRGRPTSRG